jgi:integrase/recombinase XerD
MGGRRRKGLWPDGVGCHPAGSLLDIVARWDRDLAVRQFSADTRRGHLGALGLFIAWAQERGVTQAAQVTRGMIEVYQRHLHRCRREDDRPLSPQGQYRRLKSVALCCSWAVRRGFLPANPAADLDYPRLPQHLPQTLTPAEVAAVFTLADDGTAEGIRERTALEVMYSTGLRRAEVARLELSDVDAQRGIVFVREGKGRKDRLVPIGTRALAWLDRYLAEVRPRWCRDPGNYRVFLQVSGASCTPGMLGIRIYKLMRKAGITKPGACHLFRHTMASQLLEAGCDVRVIGQLLGHTDLQTTARYTRVGILALCKMHAAFHPAEQQQAAKGEQPPSAVEQTPSVDGRA